MSARLEHFLRTQVKTYRLAFSDLATSTTGVAKIAVELIGAPNAHTKLRHIQISKPSLAISPFQLNKYSAASTGSTGQTLGTPVPARGTDTTYAGNVRLYTINPVSTAGTLVDQLQEIDIATTDVMNEHYGNDQGQFVHMLQSTAESFGLVITSTGANTLNGYIEWTVEP